MESQQGRQQAKTTEAIHAILGSTGSFDLVPHDTEKDQSRHRPSIDQISAAGSDWCRRP